jgi:hypothetical protein
MGRQLKNEIPQSAYGDATGDGIFSLADLKFVQEYFNQTPILGSQGEVADGIQMSCRLVDQWVHRGALAFLLYLINKAAKNG